MESPPLGHLGRVQQMMCCRRLLTFCALLWYHSFLAKRRLALDAYLQDLIQVEAVFGVETLVDFLDNRHATLSRQVKMYRLLARTVRLPRV